MPKAARAAEGRARAARGGAAAPASEAALPWHGRRTPCRLLAVADAAGGGRESGGGRAGGRESEVVDAKAGEALRDRAAVPDGTQAGGRHSSLRS